MPLDEVIDGVDHVVLSLHSFPLAPELARARSCWSRGTVMKLSRYRGFIYCGSVSSRLLRSISIWLWDRVSWCNKSTKAKGKRQKGENCPLRPTISAADIPIPWFSRPSHNVLYGIYYTTVCYRFSIRTPSVMLTHSIYYTSVSYRFTINIVSHSCCGHRLQIMPDCTWPILPQIRA